MRGAVAAFTIGLALCGGLCAEAQTSPSRADETVAGYSEHTGRLRLNRPDSSTLLGAGCLRLARSPLRRTTPRRPRTN